MSTAATPLRTAAAEVAALCDRLSDDPSIRIIDATVRRSRPVPGVELAEAVIRYRERLFAKGLRSGDTVLFAVRPSLAAVASFMALITVGARTVFLDLTEPADLVTARLNLIEPTWVVTEPLTALAARSPVRQLVQRIGVRIPPIHQMAPGVITTGKRRRSRLRGTPPSPGASEDALVVFTSGTTMAPQAVIHTQATLGATFATLVDLIGDAGGQIVYSDRFHGFVPAIATGACVVVASPAIPPEAAARIITGHQVNTWFTTPMTALEALDVMTTSSRLHRIVLGSAPVTPAVVQDITRHLPSVEVIAVYGMTEAVPVAVTTGAEIIAHSGDGDLVGHVVDGLDVELDSAGEIVVSGSRVARYLGAPPGPIRTGDLGHLTGDGELVLDGRINDMILVRARNIYPQHHEHWCRELPGVTDGALVGIRNRYGDEELWIVVELDPPDTPLQEVVDAISSHDHLAELPLSGVVARQLPYSGRSKKLDRIELSRRVEAALQMGSALPLHHA